MTEAVCRLATSCAQHGPTVVYTFPRAWAFALALPFVALALMLWWDAWSRCHGCEKQRAYCDCGKPDTRRPKWSDKDWRKK